ncbi:hypothetical protein LR69_01017 [Geobacillus sp. BCO2]|nr:hypothetical protein LR69_01017 [Geobacillus sp. BCO2]
MEKLYYTAPDIAEWTTAVTSVRQDVTQGTG